MGMDTFHTCGFTDSYLLPVRKRIYAANEEGINLLGAIFIRLSGRNRQGELVETAEMVYVTDSAKLFYLSRHAMEQLRIIGPTFPQIGAAALASSPPSQLPVDCDGGHARM